MYDQQIAIIGGGVSGLSAAYEIGKLAKQQQKRTKIAIYEKSSLGGNAQTVVFSLGFKRGLNIEDHSIEFIRWADLGVNDINLSAYKAVCDVMKDIGYNDKTTKNLQPLENTECYFTLDGSTAITDDRDLKQGVVNPNHSLQHLENGFLERFIDLIYEAALAKVYPNGYDQEEYLDISCGQFFTRCIENPKKQLESFAQTKPWYKEQHWRDPEWLAKASGWISQLRDCIFYPRISAMYFANECGPEEMLLAAPFHYYKMQESVGDTEPDRRYFVGGAQRWLEYLATYLKTSFDPEKSWVDIEFVYSKAQVTALTEGVQVTTSQPNSIRLFDYAVITTHADDALHLLRFDNSDKNQEAEILDILGSITYTNSMAVCHTWSGLLPPNRNLWRAYNVLIRKGAALKPYSMTYICNRHQNDAANPEYNFSGSPQFFVTLNPQRPIPDEAILRKISKPLIPEKLRNILPEETLKDAEGFTRGDEDDRAITYFYHNLLNKSCFLAQRRLKKYHQKKTNLYFGGAWSKGSGLHEECWLQSRYIAQQIFQQGEGA